ncbi:response regulator transcription factor [Salinarimonas soli]|uniref:Response regulator n=1 Tax=Salinarimonas soli TaxID=1638099 RepID=A0A5B2VCX8_9HYPH|nr:response regulator [Salinarimonas soli]KAA2236272.1 response regulator [Salinarimonas soli]
MPFRVLVVDDSRLARMAIARALSSIRPDWVRVEAGDADEAMALARQEPVQMALLDFNMPGRDGLTLASELRALDPGMPVAVISANHQEEVVRRAREIGTTFLPKPLTEQAMEAFLDQVAPLPRAGGR